MLRPAIARRWLPSPQDQARLDQRIDAWLAGLSAEERETLRAQGTAFLAGQSDALDVRRLAVNLAANIDLIDAETGVSVKELVARAFSDQEFEWSAVEQALGLTSPHAAFRADVRAI